MDAKTTSTVLASFGEQLRTSRLASGMSQEELARRSGLSTAGVGALERSVRRAPKRETLHLLADALALDQFQRAELQQAAERGRARRRTEGPEGLAASHNLPLQLTTFVGRANQIDEVARLIESNRLVTISGSGGVGKTRAALEVAMRQAQGVCEDIRFVDLAPLQDGCYLVGRVASIVGVRLPGASETAESLANILKASRMLLLLDNCEHVVVDATKTARVLLQQCPEIRILATTRERLGIMGEAVFRLPPLAIPDISVTTIAEARSYGAVELFLQRTFAADADLIITDAEVHMLIDICRRLEGIPLALELAAALVPTLGLNTLSRRLESSLSASRDVCSSPDRQQTMRDTIAWSYKLLSKPERLLLRRLSVFAGGCTLVAAEAVCSTGDLKEADVAGLLAALVDKSLVEAVIGPQSMRYVLLDSTRSFARDKRVEAGESPALFRGHARWLVSYGEGAVREYLATPHLIWLDKFWPEFDNVRAALDWATRSERHEDAVLAGNIVTSFRGLWLIPGMFAECRRWVELVLERIDERQHPSLVIELLHALSGTSTGSEMIVATDRYLAALRRSGDRSRLAQMLARTAVTYSRSGLLIEAQQALDEHFDLLTDDKVSLSSSRDTLLSLINTNFARVELSLARGQFDEARAQFVEASINVERVHDDFISVMLSTLGAEIEYVAGNVALALEYSNAAVEQANAIPRGASLQAGASCRDACIRLKTPDIDGAEAAARSAFELASALGDQGLIVISLQNVAGVAVRRGRSKVAARLLGSVGVWCEAIGYRPTVFEKTAYTTLKSALEEQLGAETETYIAEGRGTNLEVATNEALAMGEI